MTDRVLFAETVQFTNYPPTEWLQIMYSSYRVAFYDKWELIMEGMISKKKYDMRVVLVLWRSLR